MKSYSPTDAAFELREQLASEKRRLALFIGAGASMAVGLPGIDRLTLEVKDRLLPEEKTSFDRILSDLPLKSNVEHVLTRVRLYREFLASGLKKELDGLSEQQAEAVDAALCKAIYEIVSAEPPKGLSPHIILAQWLHALHEAREVPVELFTTNYDLLLERAMEHVNVPFFDGFIGSVNPFFAPTSVEADGGPTSEKICPPTSWTRLWKLHGSIGWRIRRDEGGRPRITRVAGSPPAPGEEVMIFPSREKYADSRKLPFLSYQDRLRAFLSTGETLMLVFGYSFSDEHLNEIIFQGLRSNSRLAITALVFGVTSPGGYASKRLTPEGLLDYGRSFRNLTIYGPDQACIGGVPVPWTQENVVPDDEGAATYWDRSTSQFLLGDLAALASFLGELMGMRRTGRAPQVETPSQTGVPAVQGDAA